MTDNSRLIVTPAESGTMGVNAVKRLHENRDRLMPVLLPGLDGYFVPPEPGSITMIQAQTHNAKSLFMDLWAQRMVANLRSRGRDDVIVWVDTETSADYLAMNQVSSLAGMSYLDIIESPGLNMKALMQAAFSVADVPIYTIATRLGRDGSEVHLSNINHGLEMLRSGQVDGTSRSIAAIFVDYLQALPLDPVVRKQRDVDSQRRLQVSRDVDTCRVMASRFDCPVVIGVQAKQSPDNTEMYKALRVPGGLYDGQETANIGQRADRILALSVPARSFADGQVIEYRNTSFTVRDNLLFVYVAKQRGRGFRAGRMCAYEIVPGGLAHIWND